MREEVKKLYKEYGIDVDKVMEDLKKVRISIHCWQLDDVNGFESKGSLTGGIQTTGNYPGKARDFKELTSDLEFALKYIPGSKKINLHANYQVDDIVDRRDITPHQFSSWVRFAKDHNLGLDFNPTLFSSPMLVDNMTLSSPDKEVRDYWIKHCINSLKVTEYFGKELGIKSLMNIWIPDGLKDSPADRMSPRGRLKDSLDKILYGYDYDKSVMDVSVESKVFGIGMESYTTGSHEFYMNYAIRNNILYLLDTGHFHPTENVADKISSMLLFNDKLAFHVSRPVRWDSDHVLKLNDDLQDVADELVKCQALERSYIGLDYFDASINRVMALIIGARNMEKALLKAMLTPWDLLSEAQDKKNHSYVLALQEEIKTLPWGEVWDEYCTLCGAKDEKEWYLDALKYEKDVLLKRGN
ncbi:MAG: L-rhamnose isomerase [Bacilli bacterium]|nr:L-rhamnose isomerase [Bacilli bacterium]